MYPIGPFRDPDGDWFEVNPGLDRRAEIPRACLPRSYFTSAAQNEQHKQRKLTIPVSAWAGEACLASLTKQCLEMAATDVAGGVIERCGHWVVEERPDFLSSHVIESFSDETWGAAGG